MSLIASFVTSFISTSYVCTNEVDYYYNFFKMYDTTNARNNMYELLLGNLLTKHPDDEKKLHKADRVMRNIPEEFGNSINIYYAGTFKTADVAKYYMKHYNNRIKKIVFFEPVVSNLETVKESLKDTSLSLTYNYYGLGKDNYETSIDSATPSTVTTKLHILKSKKKSENLVKIKETVSALNENNFAPTDMNMLYTNCEGCEIEVLQNLIEKDYLKHFKIVQFGTHKINIENYASILCGIRYELSKTHKRIEPYVTFGNEKWVRMY